MTDFVSNLIKKFKKPIPQDSVVTIKPSSKNLVSPDSILLNEHVKVNIYSLKEVIIDKEGVVTGNIHSKSCVVNGKVHGNILSSDYIEVKNTAIIEGNIKSGSIQIEAGSMINGFISIEKKIKLPSIVSEVAAPGTVKSGNIEDPQEGYITVKNTPPKTETPEIKAEPIIVQVPLEKPVAPVVKAEPVREVPPEPVPASPPKIAADIPEIKATVSAQKENLAQVEKKDNKIADNSPKKTDTPDPNDSWW